MKKLLIYIKGINDKKYQLFVMCIFFLQPFLELDYLAYDFINSYGIPRPSTIFHMIVIPLIVLATYIKYEEKKKKTAVLFALYMIALGVWFVLHGFNCIDIYSSLYLTNNFYFSWFQEFTYIFTLVIPYFIIYSFYKTGISKDIIRKAIIITSLIISISVILGDIFLFGLSTYNYGCTKANIFTWFFGIYDKLHPRDLASKFYFPEGNTLGIYQFIILPILYYYLGVSNNRRDKFVFTATIVLQSLAMVILSTKVATYGTVLIPIASIFVYILFVILKEISLSKNYVITVLLITGIFGFIIPNSPAYVNTQIETANDVAVLNDNYLLEIAKNELNDEGLVPGTAEFNYYYQHYFEDYGIKSKLISSVPKEYYIDYYNYVMDPKFWWDVLDLYPLEERCNGRQVQTIFNNYKWNSCDEYTKMMGMGYSTFMNGSFLIERDFVQQRYTLGYIGNFITLSPWIIVGLYGVVKLILNFSKKFKYKMVMFAMSYVIGIGASIMSGHTFDQYLTTTCMALVVSCLLTCINTKGEGE